MSSLMSLLHAVGASRPARWIGVPVLMAAALASLLSQSQVALPPTVALAAEPLYARGARAKPTLTLALSVEFPTVGAQYRNATYTPAEKYIGYFDTEGCYKYNNHVDPKLRRFDRTSNASNRSCGDAEFSGNFMNWATGSAIDVLRLGLTGGDRVVDTASMTVLQRAMLPNTSVVSNAFYNHASYFPSKRLTKEQAVGAVPKSMRDLANGDIYAANCENKVFFGTQATGSCAAPGNNANLSGASSGVAVPNPGFYNAALPSGFTQYSPEESGVSTPAVFTFGTDQQIAYGAVDANGNYGWAVMTLPANTPMSCTNAWFALQNVPGVTNGDPLNGTEKDCYRRDPVLNSDKYFYTRVSVCESSGATLLDSRNDLCQRYPSGGYKPVGNLQRYSDRIRVAAFGYLNDNTSSPQRYGGVLRAPMKYVGPKSFDANFALQSGTNVVAEWDESTGEFVKNPQGQSSINSGTHSNSPGQPISGVINYLNQFGRTGTNAGQYKAFDPVGELYYESLRYLQGLTPTPNAVSGLTDALRDGFPVYDTWLSTAAPDPHPAVSGMTDYSCLKNNILGIGDVFTHNDKSIPGNDARSSLTNDFSRPDAPSANEPDFHYWTKVVGGFESNNSVSYFDGKGVGRTTSNHNTPNTARWGMENQGTGSGNNSAYYMAGVAYWANTQDIRGAQWTDTAKQRPGMRVTTYMIDVNENSASSDATFRQNRHFYLAAKYGGFKDSSETGNPFKEKLKDGTIIDSNANWANDAGEAKNYYLASSAQALIDALNEIFENLAKEANSIAGGSISTQRLTGDNGLVYQAQFDPADWSGDLVAYPVSLAASGTQVDIGEVTESPWKNAAGVSVGAAGKLDERDIDTRNIFVGYNNGTGAGVFDTAEFRWGTLPTDIKNALKLPPGAVSGPPYDSDEIAEARLNYLRGDRASESGTGVTFRRRGSLLGDIVNSGVAFSGAPARRFADSSYGEFYEDHKDRVKALFVGANDGMLHAFNADTGDELFAYIPSWVVPRLGQLTSNSYVHQSYVDATPVVTEANIGTVADADWRTVLVSGTGGGGQGVFALDVSDPSAVTGGTGNERILWEFTDKHDPDMGNVVGKPQILRINTAAGSATPNYEYFAVVASGVNNHQADGSASTSAEPALFFLKLGKAKSASWTLGDNYFKVKFPVKTNAIASGLVGFSVRVGFSGELTYLYAGDLQGNLWKLDFTKTDAADWTLDRLSSYKVSGVAVPLFVAQDGAGTPSRQPITMEPALIFGPNRSIIVSFGTGKFLEVSDVSGPYKAQSVYAVLDNNSNLVDSGSTEAAIAGRGRLKGGTANGTTVSVEAFNWGRPATDDSTTSRAGWYFDFFGSATTTTPVNAGTGERQISGFGVLAGRLIFGSVIPATNSCGNGSGNLYVLDLLTGDGTSTVSQVGILGEPFLMQLGSPSLTKSDSVGQRKETTRWQIILQGSAGVAAPPSVTTTGTVGRLSWREISNYQNLRNTP